MHTEAVIKAKEVLDEVVEDFMRDYGKALSSTEKPKLEKDLSVIMQRIRE